MTTSDSAALASASSPAIWTVVVRSPILPVARVAAKVVLKALSTREFGRAAASSAAAEESVGTVRESNVSKFTGLVMSTTIRPASCSARSVAIDVNAWYGTARTTISPVIGLAASASLKDSTTLPPRSTTLAMAEPMLPVPKMLTVLMTYSSKVVG